MADTSTKNELDLAFEEFERNCGSNKEIRKEMINQLRKQISKIEISEYEKPMMITARLEIAKTLDGLLKSDEDMDLKRLRVKLQRKDGETNGMVGAAVVGLLKELKLNQINPANGEGVKALENAQKELDSRIEEIKKGGGKDASDLEVTDGELIECSSVMTVDRPPEDPEEE